METIFNHKDKYDQNYKWPNILGMKQWKSNIINKCGNTNKILIIDDNNVIFAI